MYLYLITLLIIAVPQLAFAGVPDPEPVLYEEICEIRQMFCGGAGLVFASATIVTLGIMVFVGKITWRTVLVTAAGLLIFLGAEGVVESIFSPPPGSDVVSACSCV